MREDVGDGDHTTLACIPAKAKGRARLIIKDEGILAGVQLAPLIFGAVDSTLRVNILKKDGARVKPGDVVLTVQGSARAIVTAERLVLNCMQRMSGIASKTHQLAQACMGTRARLLDTRKTTPGIRMLEKWAVLIGGGHNHRFGLFDMVLIKDNHIDYCGSASRALASAKYYLKRKKKKLRIEVEVRNLEELREVLREGGAHRILLDNFSPALMKKAVSLVNGRAETEASGGINESNIRAYALTGVDYISVGALTHSFRSLDMSLKAF
ncbi:MAG: carboxylating nicotinate-nucleotide diphosphorylase [Bacteroidota bacterium]